MLHHESASGPERFRRIHENRERLRSKWAGRVEADVHRDANGMVTLREPERLAA